jgi:hypothetical protein
VPATRNLHNPGVAVERSDAPPWLIAILAAGLAVFCVVSAVTLMAIFPSALSGPSDAPGRLSEKPRLQIDPAADLAAYREIEAWQLDGYGWIDSRRGIVRIPIERAMQDVAAGGIKDWPRDAK